ncbi:hypothetical protein FQR65_LT20028 [Abscondita terminalis]|nr:hypothetical protein FQR65_LT20028 [Abscondita terminalis]
MAPAAGPCRGVSQARYEPATDTVLFTATDASGLMSDRSGAGSGPARSSVQGAADALALPQLGGRCHRWLGYLRPTPQCNSNAGAGAQRAGCRPETFQSACWTPEFQQCGHGFSIDGGANNVAYVALAPQRWIRTSASKWPFRDRLRRAKVTHVLSVGWADRGHVLNVDIPEADESPGAAPPVCSAPRGWGV